MEIHDSVLDLIGNTPLVNLKQVAKDKPCKVVVKAEMTNPGGSSKDRPAVSMIDHAEREGLLNPAARSSNRHRATPVSASRSWQPSAGTSVSSS